VAGLSVQSALAELKRLADPAQAAVLRRFFKTGPGEYGEGDRFLGIKVPVIRSVAWRHRGLPQSQVIRLLKSEWHEARLAALVILTLQFEKADESLRQRIHGLYLRHTRCINNWDLVDLSAPNIVGAYLLKQGPAELESLARSESLWERRIAIVATHAFIRRDIVSPTLRLARMLLADEHDLIHKAVGWMLREVGKRDRAALESFLRSHCRRMPRTMLRYAIERLPEESRRAYLDGSAAALSRPEAIRPSP
jgi:3-methyladenine DNA glycosylase AlkD